MSINPKVDPAWWDDQPRAVVRELDGLFPGFSWGTYNGHEPTRGRAADAMVPGYTTAAGIAKGAELAQHLWDNRDRYNIWYVIWRERIISRTYEAAGWRRYYPSAAAIKASPDSAYHRNHAHFSEYLPKPTPYGTVWLDRLLPGVEDSESIRIVQRALGVPTSGTLDVATLAATKAFQRSLDDAEQYCNGLLGKWQLAALLRDRKVWATLRTDPSGEPLPVDDPVPPVVVVTPPPEPKPKPKPEPVEYPAPTSGEVYLDKLNPGQTDSDSVAYVQDWLEMVLKVALPRTGDYDTATAAAVKAYQRDVLNDDPEYVDGDLGERQTVALAVRVDADVTIYRDSDSGGQVWPAVAKPAPVVKPTQPKPEEPPVSRTLTFTFNNPLWNNDKDRPWGPRKAGLVREILSTNPDVFGVCEIDPAQCRDIYALLGGDGSGWSYWRIRGGSKYGPLALFWRQATMERSRDAVEHEYSDDDSRYLLSLQLVHKPTGEAVWFDVTHLENNGDPDTNGGARRKIQAGELAARTRAGKRIGGGDLNSTTPAGGSNGAKPRPIMRKAGLSMLSEQPAGKVTNRAYASHHSDLTARPKGPWIDDLWWRGVSFVKGGMVLTSHSDHNILWARFTL